MNTAPTPLPLRDTEDHSSGEALSSTYAIASVGVGMLTMLETLLPAAALEVERQSLTMTEHFSTLTSYIDSHAEVPEEVKKAVSGIIVGMQFQDRNTQIMDNVAGMLERYRSMLEEVCGNIEAAREGKAPAGHQVTVAIEHILSSIRLSDIRARYMAALAKTKLSPAAQVLEMPATTPIEDIELF